MKYLLTLALGCWLVISQAQPDMSLPSLRRTYQSTYVNPGFAPAYKLSIGLPGISNLYINQTWSGFTLNDIFESNDPTDGNIDLNKFHSRISKDGIYFNTSFQTDAFHVSFPIGSFQASIHSGTRVFNTVDFSYDFLGFLINGNASLAGRNADFKAFDMNVLAYQETGFSLQKSIGRLSVGARAKYILGIANVQTTDVTIGVQTPSNSVDPLVIKLGGRIQTGGIPLVADTVDGKAKTDEQNSVAVGTNNSGVGLDFGATYQLLRKLSVHASVTDLGGINWKSNAFNYKLNNRSVQFDGFSDAMLNSDSVLNAYLDSLQKELISAEVTTGSFRTALRTRYFVGADYDLTKRDRIGFLYQMQQLPARNVSAVTFSYTRKFGVNWNVTANYSLFNNVSIYGLGTAWKWGPVQVYLISDDLMIYFKPETQNTVYFRFGINLAWSRNEGKRVSTGE
jgi:hypothetical protein